MTLAALLNELARRRLRVQPDGEQLLLTGGIGALDSELREALALHKRDLVALLHRQMESDAVPIPLISDPVRRHEPFPLTDIQQAYWVGRTSALSLGSVGCHYYQEFEHSSLDFGRFEEAFRQLIRRHDMLRAVVETDGRQRILPDVPAYRIAVTDLRGLRPEASEEQLQRLRGDLSHQVFSPDEWPQFTVRAAILDGGRTRICVSFDLLMIDAASMSLLIRDWERLYRDSSTLAPLTLSFRDCVVRAVEERAGERFQKALEYWDARLETLPGPPELPWRSSGESGPVQESICRERRKGRVSRARWMRLKELGERSGITPSALLATAFGDVLGAWSRGCQFLLNLTLCRRPTGHPDIEHLLGDFTTTVLLAIDPAPGEFRERARRVHAQMCSDLDFAEVSGIEVSRRLRGRRPDIPQVAAPVVFTSLLGQPGAGALFSSNWIGDLVYGVSQTPQVALDHQAFEDGGGLVFHWDFVPAAFTDGVVDAMFGAYQDLLNLLASEDNAWSDSKLCLLPAEQRAMRAAANDTAASFPPAVLHTLFADRARLTPEAIAVVSPERTLTYGDLDRLSAALAYRLARLGAGTNRLVAVVMEKGWEEVVAVLGILRAGAAYLPIDARMPAARIRQLLLQGGVEIAVTQDRVDRVVDGLPGMRWLAISEDLAEMPPGSTLPAASAGDLAYVIFTSGSTGQPKGVMIDHQGAVNTILDINHRFQVGRGDRVLALSSLGFDLSVYDIFGTLAAGGAIVIPRSESTRDPQAMALCVTREGVTIWNSVPALMGMLVEYASGAGMQLPTLRLVLLSGDWIPVSLPARVRAVAPHARLISLGGATEASIWSIIHSIEETDGFGPSIPYGKALANQTMHVLNDRLDSSPDFVRGEIFIGGIGLAKGYWRNPEETAARFISHPHSGQKLYRTGDMGRFLPNGDIELLGREDFQVKIQGHRIELGEIESTLRRAPDVRDVVVVARGDRDGGRQLIAYVVAGGEADRTAEWRGFLSDSLPSYMVPAVFVRMESLPLTPNHKINRAALPEVRPAMAAGGCAPSPTDTESVISNIIASVLGSNGFGRSDPLFSFGCTSLHIVQIHRRLCETFGRRFSVAEIFNRPTVALIVDLLAQTEESAPSTRKANGAYRSARAELAGRRGQARKART